MWKWISSIQCFSEFVYGIIITSSQMCYPNLAVVLNYIYIAISSILTVHYGTALWGSSQEIHCNYRAPNSWLLSLPHLLSALVFDKTQNLNIQRFDSVLTRQRQQESICSLLREEVVAHKYTWNGYFWKNYQLSKWDLLWPYKKATFRIKNLYALILPLYAA